MLDVCMTAICERFQQLNQHAEIWGFLYKMDDLPCDDETLKKNCLDLKKTLAVEKKSDIDGSSLLFELKSFKKYVTSESAPLDVLNFICKNKLEDLYPNIWISLRILLTTPVSVASGERSFSKLKLIKTSMRSTMSQENLNSLAMLSIENEMVEHINFSEVIEKFASQKARKKLFL